LGAPSSVRSNSFAFRQIELSDSLGGENGTLLALGGGSMAIRIDTAEMHGTTVISVQGQLVGDASAELRRVLALAEPPLVIDLAMLQTARYTIGLMDTSKDNPGEAVRNSAFQSFVSLPFDNLEDADGS